MLSRRTLRALRRVSDQFLDQVATIKRPSRSSNGAGGFTTTFSPVASGVACRVFPTETTPIERVIAGKVVSVREWNITFTAEMDIREQDRIVVTSMNNRTFEVSGGRSGSYAAGEKVVVKEL